MSGRTPAPWVIDEENNWIHAMDARHTVVCTFGNMKHPGVLADARLIAASPRLLEALRRFVAEFEDCIEGGKASELMQFASEAIAKAEGS